MMLQTGILAWKMKFVENKSIPSYNKNLTVNGFFQSEERILRVELTIRPALTKNFLLSPLSVGLCTDLLTSLIYLPPSLPPLGLFYALGSFGLGTVIMSIPALHPIFAFCPRTPVPLTAGQ